jgi:hypothetical protein
MARGLVNVLLLVALILGCDKTSQDFEITVFYFFIILLGKQMT